MENYNVEEKMDNARDIIEMHLEEAEPVETSNNHLGLKIGAGAGAVALGAGVFFGWRWLKKRRQEKAELEAYRAAAAQQLFEAKCEDTKTEEN